jgi:membrane protein DedA with SNARE-associated domain
MASFEQWVLNLTSSVYNAIQWPGVILLMVVESCGIPFPSEIIMPLAGWMLLKEKALPVYSVFMAGGYGALGNTIGSIIAYYIGMWAGRPLILKYCKYILLSKHDLDMTDRWFSRRGTWTLLVSRVLPIVRTYISFPAGIAKMNIFKFIIYTFIGSFVWSTGLAYGGYLLGEHWEEISTAIRPFDPLIIALVVIAIGFYIWRHLRNRREEKSSSSEHGN